MAARLAMFVPRFVVLTLVALLATTTLTFAAENRTVNAAKQQAAAPAKAARKVIVVPDVQNQVYVFAKGSLEEAGFAWRVIGSVAGYSANRVAAQSPAPGTRVIDTGAPTISLTLSLNPGYPQDGTPEKASPFRGTAIEYAGYSANRVAVQSPAPGTRVVDTGAPTISLSLSLNPGYPQDGTPENASPFRGTAIEYAGAAANRVAVPKAKPKKRAAPKRKAPKKKQAPAPKPKARVKAKPKVRPAPKPKKGKRPPAFVVPGGRPEPQHELPLPDRARLLGVWLSSHQSPSEANVRYWLYQHAWVVEGARLGWWHGAEALGTLIRLDQRVQALWGIGAKSEGVARAALLEVRAKSR